MEKEILNILLSNLWKDLQVLRSLIADCSYGNDDIRNHTLYGLKNNYHEFAMRYSLIFFSLQDNNTAILKHKDILNITQAFNLPFVRESWDRTSKRNYILDLWMHYESYFRTLYQIIVTEKSRDEIEESIKRKYKEPPRTIHIPINKICSAVMKEIRLPKSKRHDFNKFTQIFLHIRNSLHNNTISQVSYSYDLLGVTTAIEKNKYANCLNFEQCFKFAIKAITVVKETGALLGEDEIKNPLVITEVGPGA